MAILVLQLPMTKQHFASFDPWVFLFLVKVLQFIDIVLTVRLPFLQVDVSEDPLDDGDLQAKHQPIKAA